MDDYLLLNFSLKMFLIVALFLIVGIWWRLSRVYRYWADRGIPFDKPSIVFGNLGFLMRSSVPEFFSNLRKKHLGDYVGIYLMWEPALVVQSPDLARKVLVKDAEVFQDRYMYSNHEDKLGSLNILTLKNPLWAKMRSKMSPMFTSAKLKRFTELMNINARELVKKVERDFVEKNKPVNLKELFSMYASDTVGYTVFGLRVSALSEKFSPLWDIVRNMVNWNFRRGLEFTLFLLVPRVAQLLRMKFFSAEASNLVKSIFWNVVAERQKTGKTSERDLVTHLVQLKENLKEQANIDDAHADDLMMAQAAVFIFGSVDTSSTTLTYCLHELAHHPDIQEQLFNEIDDALTRSGKEMLDYDDLQNLKFLGACVYETLRKHTPIPFLDRVCKTPYKLTDDVTLEAGTVVFINIQGMHHDEKLFPDPQRWDPTRPTAAHDNDNMDFTFLPFGDGPRFCIGKRYGVVQVRTALAHLIHKFKLEPTSPYNSAFNPYSVLLAPKDGGNVKFVPRY